MLFIIHRTANETVALDLLERARRQGYEDRQLFLDSDPGSGIRLGDSWQLKIDESLAKARAIIVLCSPDLHASNWCFVELGYAKAMATPIFPVIIEKCVLGSVLDSIQAIDVSQAKSDTERDVAYEPLWQALRDKHLGPRDILPWPPENSTDDCPYPGLSYFDAEFAPVYFGREQERNQVTCKLEQMRKAGLPRMLLIAGGSGSGKSSLLRAGVWPWLEHKIEKNHWLPLPIFRYNEDNSLLSQLAVNLTACFPIHLLPDWTLLREAFEDADPIRAARNFSDQVCTLNLQCGCGDRTVVMLIDQFEELLSPTHGTSGESFLRFLHALLQASDRHLLVIGTIRSDFLDIYERQRFALQPPYFETFRLPPFPFDRITDVIVEPGRRAGVTFTNEVLERLKGDFPWQDDPDRILNALPLLAFVLEKLFHKATSCSKNVITASHYAEICGDGTDGMVGAIQQAIKTVLPSKLAIEMEEALRKCFISHLVQPKENGGFIRRRAYWSELPPVAHQLLNALVDARILYTCGEGPKRTVEVMHESVFRCWPLLAEWLEKHGDLVRWRQDIGRDRLAVERNGVKWPGLNRNQLRIGIILLASCRELLEEHEKSLIRSAIARRWAIFALISLIGFSVIGGGTWLELSRRHEVTQRKSKEEEIQTLQDILVLSNELKMFGGREANLDMNSLLERAKRLHGKVMSSDPLNLDVSQKLAVLFDDYTRNCIEWSKSYADEAKRRVLSQAEEWRSMAERLFEACSTQFPDKPELVSDLLNAKERKVTIARELGNLTDALAFMKSVRDGRQQLVSSHPKSLEFNEAAIRSQLKLVQTLLIGNNHVEAEAELRDCNLAVVQFAKLGANPDLVAQLNKVIEILRQSLMKK